MNHLPGIELEYPMLFLKCNLLYISQNHSLVLGVLRILGKYPDISSVALCRTTNQRNWSTVKHHLNTRHNCFSMESAEVGGNKE